jgi:hypothetical protein
MLDEIPRIPKNLEPSICALANAAFIFRGVFVQAAEGKSIADIRAERCDTLLLAERVIDKWCKHLGIAIDGPQRDSLD